MSFKNNPRFSSLRFQTKFKRLFKGVADGHVLGYAVQISGANLGHNTISSNGRIAMNCTAALGSGSDLISTNAGAMSKVGLHMLRTPA